MSFLDHALQEVSEAPTAASLGTFRKHLDPRWIEEALQATGTATLRKRRLPADQVIWLVVGMAMMRDRPLAEVVSRLELALPGQDGTAVVAPSSVVQARQRLGSDPVEWLFNRCAEEWAHQSAASHRWRGLALYGVDGTTLRVADSKENRDHFGLASGPRSESGYPLVRLAALMALSSHLLARVSFGPYAVSEIALCKGLWEHVPDATLTLVDRNFLSAQILIDLQRGGTNRHWLTRTKSTTQWEVLESFGRYDKLVELTVSAEAKRKDPSLPDTYTARAVSYRHSQSKGRQWLLTSLVNPKEHPAVELIEIYHVRWELELGYDEIKTHLLEREETIRSRTKEGVNQELWGILLTYNLIRFEMEKIAKEADVPPNRISFVTALRFIRDEWLWCCVASPGSIPSKLQKMRARILQFVLPERRRDRVYPRAVKIKMSNYAKKKRKNARRTPK